MHMWNPPTFDRWHYVLPPAAIEAIISGNDAEFWSARRDDFARHVKQFHHLTAHWIVRFRQWHLWWHGPTIGELTDNSPPNDEVAAILDTAALKALSSLQDLQSASATPHHAWLDVMLYCQAGTRLERNVPVTEREWLAGCRWRRALAEVRKHLGCGTLNSEAPFTWIETLRIDHVYQASANLCDRLSAIHLAREKAEKNSSGVGLIRPTLNQWITIPPISH